jgi:hypothetical protein
MSEQDPENPLDRIWERAAVFAKHLDQSLVEISNHSHEDNGTVSNDTVSAIIVALIMHANCYVKALKDRGAPHIHMEALSKLAETMSDQVFSSYESNTTDKINVKGPDDSQ